MGGVWVCSPAKSSDYAGTCGSAAEGVLPRLDPLSTRVEGVGRANWRQSPLFGNRLAHRVHDAGLGRGVAGVIDESRCASGHASASCVRVLRRAEKIVATLHDPAWNALQPLGVGE